MKHKNDEVIVIPAELKECGNSAWCALWGGSGSGGRAG